MKCILVTGSEGFIGKELCEHLRKLNYIVKGIDKKTGIDVLDISELTLTSGCSVDCVVHLAAQTSVWNDNIEQIHKDNIQAFMHIFNLCKKLNIKFIYASSSCSINVTSMYGLSKQFADGYAKIYGWDNCIGLRFHNVYGPNSRKNTLMGVLMNNYDIQLYNSGNNIRHFTHIYDTINAIIFAINNKLNPGIYNIVNPEEWTIKEFAYEVFMYKQQKLNITCIPNIRKYDKEIQKIDNSLPNLIIDIMGDTYIPNKTGIKQCFCVKNV